MVFSNTQATTYNDKVVRQFAIMTVVFGVIGMLVGVIIAAQLTWPELNLGIPWLSYGRLRPLHTNAVIFAFGGSGLFAASYYVVQRTCHVRPVSYTHLRAHETPEHLVCRLLLETKKKKNNIKNL